jgi:hypothetical protein
MKILCVAAVCLFAQFCASCADAIPERWAQARLPESTLALFPENAIAVVELHDLDASFARSILAKFLSQPAIAGLARFVERRNDNLFQLVLEGAKATRACAGVWEMADKIPMNWRMGCAIELPAENPDEYAARVIGSLSDQNPLDTFTTGPEGLSICSRKNGMIAYARTGKCLLLGANVESVKELAGRMLAPGGLDKSPRYIKTASVLPEGAYINLAIDNVRMLEVVGQINPNPTLMQRANLMNSELYDYRVYRLYAQDGGFLEKISSLLKDEYQPDEEDIEAHAEWLKALPDNPLPASFVPNDVALAGFFDLEGSELAATLPFVAPLVDAYMLQDQIKRNIPEARRVTLSHAIEAVEGKTGFTIDELLEPLTGTHSYWLMPPNMPRDEAHLPELTIPVMGMLLECMDDDAALDFAENLEQIARGITSDAITLHGEKHGEQMVWILDFSAAVPEQFRDHLPKQLLWTPWKDRVALSTSLETLLAYLAAREQKKPSLADLPAYAETLKALSPAEQHDQAFYVDVPHVGACAIEYGRVYLRMFDFRESEFGKALKALPPGSELCKDLTPLLYWADNSRTDIEVTSLRSPIGMFQTVAFLQAILSRKYVMKE